MIPYDILCSSLTLLHRENKLGQTGSSNGELIKNIIQLDKNSDKRRPIGADTNFNTELTNLVIDYINYPENYDDTTLIDTLGSIYRDRLDQLPPLSKSLTEDQSDRVLKNSIVKLSNRLTTYYKEYSIKNLITRFYKDMNSTDTEKTISEKTSELIVNLETYLGGSKKNDPAIIDEIDMGDEQSLQNVVQKVKDNSENANILQSGWKELNKMTQGGFRRGEMWMVGALPHNYKSGLLQSLFVQFCIHNKPVMKDKNKKPMIIYISFEDNSEIFTPFMFKYLYLIEHNELPNIKKISKEEMSSYIKSKLTVNGFHPVTLRVDPLKWTIKDLMNKIISYEAVGYEIHACIIDYLSKMPTTGCDHSGPGGTDVRDMFQRCRQFFTNETRQALCITAHQLDTVSRNLIKQDKTELEFSSANIERQKRFVHEVAGKGYTELSKQIDQVVDGEIYIHIVRCKEESILTMMRGKHRYGGNLREPDKYQELKFLPEGPPRETINEPDVLPEEELDSLGF